MAQTPLVRLLVDSLYSKLYNKSNQWSLSHTVRAMLSVRRHLRCHKVCAVNIALAYRQCAMAKFSKSRVWEKVTEGNTLFF